MKKNEAVALYIFWGEHPLTTSKAVPQRSIDDAPRTIKGRSTPVCVIVGHCGVVVRVRAGKLLKNLASHKERAQSQLKSSAVLERHLSATSIPTCSSGVGENILSS